MNCNTWLLLFILVYFTAYSPNSTWLDSTRLDSTRHFRRVESMHFWLCRHCRTAQLDSIDVELDWFDWLDTTRATRNLVCCVISIKL